MAEEQGSSKPKGAVTSPDQKALLETLTELHDDAVALMRNRDKMPMMVQALDQFEQASHADRKFVMYGAGGLWALYMMFGYFAALLANIIGIAYPSYASFKAIRTERKDDDTQWLTYWCQFQTLCVFGVYSVLDFFADPIMSVLPLYWLAKCIFLAWLYLPQFMGAQRLYDQLVAPMFTIMETKFAPNSGAGGPTESHGTTTIGAPGENTLYDVPTASQQFPAPPE